MQKIQMMIIEIAEYKIKQQPDLRPKVVKESIYRQWGITSLKELEYHQVQNAIDQLTKIIDSLKNKQIPNDQNHINP